LASFIVKMTVSPSRVTESTPRMMPSAPDLDSLPEWRTMVATTSSGVISLPLWNCTPLRILKTQALASGDECHSVARRGSRSPLGDRRSSSSPQARPTLNVTWLAASAGSMLSVAAPPCMPIFRMPPRRGPAACAAPASRALAAVADRPSAAARPRKSRRELRPRATCWLRYSSSRDIVVASNGLAGRFDLIAKSLRSFSIRSAGDQTGRVSTDRRDSYLM
jgi:hypothetical protein